MLPCKPQPAAHSLMPHSTPNPMAWPSGAPGLVVALDSSFTWETGMQTYVVGAQHLQARPGVPRVLGSLVLRSRADVSSCTFNGGGCHVPSHRGRFRFSAGCAAGGHPSAIVRAASLLRSCRPVKTCLGDVTFCDLT